MREIIFKKSYNFILKNSDDLDITLKNWFFFKLILSLYVPFRPHNFCLNHFFFTINKRKFLGDKLKRDKLGKSCQNRTGF